ncbi:NAD/NADP transhydrogenase beta subunit [Amycolatopsis bartoniae]|uniref:Uncharacterized protein n=1 Tax=Amycolatopsis bartoniae TaxID=941986 RepID=A0A8H9IYU7_9PSEU|nr:hypothetical protein [Amycolatopsis bartoniae]MBB2938752.1 NAD/NADP transhydrogenase beta subunit [Amycolatopsis bartoniae]TVT11470.1 hypothetical protein FNH07_01180 [Amycolatopsis bartoniae]GHF79912.1 hypothetical protein GCM10017566_62670 [Amycolatopsis bartoniae]
MKIDWAALGSVFLIALVAVAVLTSLFAVGVRGLAARTTAREGGTSGGSGLTTAVVCFAICVAVVGYGIYLIVAA